MEIAREAIERITTNLTVPVALHACGNVTRIFKHMLQWRGITMLSHAFVSDDNFEVLKLKETQNSDKMIGLGCIDTTTKQIEELSDIEELIKRALEIIPADRIAVHPDCGLKLLPRDIALEKLKRMITAANRVGLSD